MNCIFCKIIAGEIPSKKLYEDEQVLAFYDIEPKAPVHFLVIPKIHLTGCGDITADNSGVVAHVFETIARLTAKLGVDSYRVITNKGAGAGQTVHHLHFHVLGGRALGEMG